MTCLRATKTYFNTKYCQNKAKMARYHIFWKFLAQKHCFGIKWQSTTFLRTQVSETRVPHQFCHRGMAELEFVRFKKNYVVLELGKLKYHATQYSSILGSSTFFLKKKKLHSIEFGKLEYCLIFFFFVFCLGIINK